MISTNSNIITDADTNINVFDGISPLGRLFFDILFFKGHKYNKLIVFPIAFML